MTSERSKRRDFLSLIFISKSMSFCPYNKKNITRQLEDMNFIFEWQKQNFTHSLRLFVKYFFATRKYNSHLRATSPGSLSNLITSTKTNHEPMSRCFQKSKGALPRQQLMYMAIFGLCIKVGRGQGDGDIGTRVRGLGTWGRETRDLGTSSMGRGDEGTSKTRTQGTRDVNDYCKSRR